MTSCSAGSGRRWPTTNRPHLFPAGTSAAVCVRPGSEQALELLTDRLVDYKALVDRVDPADLPDAVDAALRGMEAIVIGPGLDERIATACGRSGRQVGH